MSTDEISTQDITRGHLYRTYPQLYPVVINLVRQYNDSIRTIGEINKNGDLEVEALFGRRLSSGEVYFDNGLSPTVINRMYSMLISCISWDSVSEWYIVYDYYTPEDERIRVSYENKVQTITRIRKQKLSFVDCAYSRDSKSSQEKDWELHDYIIRVNMKYEITMSNIPEMVEFDAVKISVRRYFVSRSSCLPSISFRFELIQYWTGSTLAGAEQNMKTRPPKCTFECEILNLPKRDTMSEDEKTLMFISLLLKMQDFLDIPMYIDHVHNTNYDSTISSLMVL